MQGTSKINERPMGLKGDIVAGRLEGSVNPGRSSEHEEGSQGAAQFSAHTSVE